MKEITEDEMFEALHRSGYLMESEIVKQLTEMGLSAWPNEIILDPFTGKGREIDIVAGKFVYGRIKRNIAHAGIRFVFEVKNNPTPLVLLTKIHTLFGYKEVQMVPKGANMISDTMFEEYITDSFSDEDAYAQYSCFSNKNKGSNKGELMALHDDDFHAGLSKIAQYCEDAVESGDKEPHATIYSHILYLPVLLINDGLYELETSKEGEHSLKQVDCSKLLFNYYYKQEPKNIVVYIVTRKGLSGFIEKTLEILAPVLSDMIEAYNENPE